MLDDRPDPPHRPESVSSCASFLAELTRSGHVAIDDSWEIIREYRARMQSSGQPGPGDAFLPADGKFIRTALGCSHPRIAEAVDGLWWKRRSDFEAVGIEINFLCPEEIRANSDRKHGQDLPGQAS